jgi:hypothetical protein
VSDPRQGTSRDSHIAEVQPGGDTGTGGQGGVSYRPEETQREAMNGRLMELAVWLSEHPREARKNLKAIRRGNPIDPGVYYNSGLRMIERLYRPQHVALGNKMFRISTDPAAPLEEIRRKVLEGKR